MRYGRRLVQILVAERGLWAVCMASALLMAAPLLIPFPTFGEKTLRDEVRINLDIAGQTTPSAEDLASMPEDMRELMAESREALSDAGAAEDAGSFYDAVIRRCNAELEMIDKGYLSGDRDTDELRLRFAELMRDLDDPDYLGTSLDASALDAISLAPASMPALLALLPSLAIAFLVQRAVGQQRLMGQAADPAIRIVSSSVCSMLCAAAAILLTLVPAAAIALVRNGLGDPGYPVLHSQVGQTIVWSAAGCAAWTAALLVLASCFVAAAASAISLIFGKAFAGSAVLAILALLSGMPQYYLASSPLSGIVPFLPMSYACPSKVVGYAGIFPYMDLADSVALSPAFGCLVLAVGAAICVLCAVALDAAMRWHRAARLAPQGAGRKMLSLQHATIGYGRNIILEDASFELRPKSICGLVAPNGFGKTTLLRALSGTASLMKHGSVVLDGESVYARQDVRTKLFFGPSDESLLYPQKTGTFHLKLVQELWESGAESGTAAALLGIEGFAGRPVRTYSQGMKRQLLLAMAYASQASYILLDEPLNALDPDKAERGCAALFRMAEEGAAILVASHQPEELDRICDSYLVFKGTKLAVVPKQGSCRELFHRCYGKDAERRG